MRISSFFINSFRILFQNCQINSSLIFLMPTSFLFSFPLFFFLFFFFFFFGCHLLDARPEARSSKVKKKNLRGAVQMMQPHPYSKIPLYQAKKYPKSACKKCYSLVRLSQFFTSHVGTNKNPPLTD